MPNTSYQKDAQRTGRIAGLFNGWKTTLKFIREKRRLAGGPAVWLEAPAYVPDLARVYLRKMSSAERAFVWGPKFPGISTVLERQGLLDAAAIQWLLCEQYVSADLAGLGPDRVHELRYEDLVREPRRIVGDLAGFAGLTNNAPLVEAAARMLSPRPERWRENLSDADVLRLEAWLRPVLERHGYLDAGVVHA